MILSVYLSSLSFVSVKANKTTHFHNGFNTHHLTNAVLMASPLAVLTLQGNDGGCCMVV
jgi:hypothetical protein